MERIAVWWSLLLCKVDGHQWMPNGGGQYVCVRFACRGRTVKGHP